MYTITKYVILLSFHVSIVIYIENKRKYLVTFYKMGFEMNQQFIDLIKIIFIRLDEFIEVTII